MAVLYYVTSHRRFSRRRCVRRHRVRPARLGSEEVGRMHWPPWWDWYTRDEANELSSRLAELPDWTIVGDGGYVIFRSCGSAVRPSSSEEDAPLCPLFPYHRCSLQVISPTQRTVIGESIWRWRPWCGSLIVSSQSTLSISNMTLDLNSLYFIWTLHYNVQWGYSVRFTSISIRYWDILVGDTTINEPIYFNY